MKGFTLIELLVVIAILAVLATAIVLVLNPAELLRQSRDSTRMSDLMVLNKAISLFLTDQQGTGWPPVATTTCTGPNTLSATTTTPYSMGGITCFIPATTTLNVVNGTGWVNLNFNSITGGTPIGRLPVDPVNNSSSTIYVWRASTTVGMYEIDARMESVKYGVTAGTNVMLSTDDGGNNDNWYEVGRALSELP
jgi:prepilin-type N-terminal cleavage/methylation domain-containing protein